MGDTLATMREIRNHLAASQAEQAASWAAIYPYSVELEDKHYTWDRDYFMTDLAPQIEEWLVDHVGEDFGIRRRTLGFKDRDAAFAFRMRWA